MTGDDVILICFLLLLIASTAGVILFFAIHKQHRKPVRRRLRLIAGNALVLLLIGSVTLMGGEIYYRFFYDRTDAFGMTKVNQDWLKRHYHYNSVGMRDSVDYALKRGPGVRRVTFVGDSFTAGHGVKDVEHRFANRVRQTLSHVEVHVFAVNGFDTLYEMRNVEELAASGYEFDVTVLVYVPNDIMQTLPPQNHPVERVRAAADPSWVAQHSYLFNTWYYRRYFARQPATASYYQFIPEAYEGPAWPVQQQLLQRIRLLVESSRGRFAVVTFPFLHELGADNPYRTVHEKLGAFWQRNGVPHLDLLPVFESHAGEDLIVHSRDPHPNERAHQLAADAIAAFVREQFDRSP